MKKIIKNILLVFVILYTVLNATLYIYNKVNEYIEIKIVVDMVANNAFEDVSIKEEELYNYVKERYGEGAPALAMLTMESRIMGQNYMLEQEEIILVTSVILGIAIGTIVSLSENSKTKQILYFILLGVIIALLTAISNQIEIVDGKISIIQGIMDEFIYIVEYYGLYYVALYFICFIIRYFINKKNADKLNEELKNKQK